jgi:HEAT repeat protein
VEVKDRVVCLVYGDSGSRPVSQRRLSEFLLLCRELPNAFRDVLVFRKQRFGTVAAPPPPTSTQGLGWSPAVPSSTVASGGRAHSFPGLTVVAPTQPPSDFGPLLARLTGPDSAARTSAVAELARTPEASARELSRRFPGPTAWSRLPVTELPEAEELGPIPTALSRLGRHGASALAPLLDAQDADVRYYALLTAGSLPFPELVGGVLRGLFDYEPDIASAARAAATTLRRLPRFDTAMRDLRTELAAEDPLRRSMAARVVGALRDRDSIEALIQLTSSDDSLVSQAAAEALHEITRANLGIDPQGWNAWWSENQARTRAEWLVTALRHADVDVRLAAIDELTRALNDNLGYAAEASLVEREAAVGRWLAALAQMPKLKRSL